MVNAGRISNIEVIDLNGDGSNSFTGNSLILSAAEVMRVSGATDDLIVNGGSDDTVMVATTKRLMVRTMMFTPAAMQPSSRIRI